VIAPVRVTSASELPLPRFEGRIILGRIPGDDRQYIVEERFRFIDSKGNVVDVPKLLLTDGTSVGRVLGLPVIGFVVRWIIDGDQFTGPFADGAIPHDLEYGSVVCSSLWEAFVHSLRAAADRRYREAAMCRWVLIGDTLYPRKPAPAWRAWAAWAVLRLLGAPAFMEDNGAARESLRAMGLLSVQEAS